jgi:peptidoglycan/xylan/chitin deacetylase (PgdA/CDA1 family)
MATSRFPIARCAWAGRVILATLLVVLCCASSASAQTVVSLTFDDGIQTQLGAASVLESHGMRGTFYINSGTVGSKGFFMSWPQVDGLASTGHEIGGHTIDHQRLTTLTAAAQRQEVCDDATTLRSRGYAITDFAYPYGAGSVEPGVLSALSDCGYLSARKVGEIRGDIGCDNCPAADTLPPGNRYGMRSTPVTVGPITLSMLEGWVTQAEAGGGVLPIVFHSICDGCEDASVSITDFTAFIDWLSARSVIGTVVKPVNRALAEGPQHPPATTSITCNGGACGATAFKAPVSIALAATDGGGGLGATRYTLDGSDPTPSSTAYTGPFSVSATTVVKFRTWDLTDNPEPVRTKVVNVDAVAPTVQVTSPADGTAMRPGPATVKVDAADVGSGVGEVQLFVDGDYVDSVYGPGSPYQFTVPATMLALGNHRVKATAIDVAGNKTSSAIVTIAVTDGLPTTTISCDGGACPANFVKGPVSVTLSATDGGAGLGATRYTLDGSDPSTSSQQYTGPFSLTDATTVKFRTWDASGNPEQVRSQALKIDATGPAAQIVSPAGGMDLLSRNDVNVLVDATDAGSGVDEVQLFVDGDYYDYSRSKSTPYQVTIPAGKLALGTHRLKAIATDKLGNRTDSLVTYINVKDGLPTTTITCDGGACPAGFVKGPVSMRLSATDGGAGLGATRYALDGTDPSDTSPLYSGPLSLTDSVTVKFRSWDAAGNPEPVRTQVLKIDGAAPTTQITSPTDGASLLARNPLDVKVDATDPGSGIADVQLLVDGDYLDSKTGSSPFQFSLAAGSLALGTHRLKAIATDKLGNTASASETITIKDGLPTTAIACDGGACPTGFVKGPVSVTLAATDGGAGLGATRFTLDGSDPTATSPDYAGPLTLTETTTVKFRSWEAAGNPEPVRSRTLKIDGAAPIANIASPADGATLYLRDQTVKIDATDAGSGIADVQLFVDGDYYDYSRGTSSPYQFTLPEGKLALGTHRLKALVTDAIGNSTSTSVATITLKEGLPTTTIACDGGACPAGFVKGPVSVALSATDGGGGLGATRYTLDGSDPISSSPEYSAPFTLADTTTVKFRSWDSAGHPEQVRTQTLKIDAAAPTAAITSPTEGTSLLARDSVTVKVDAADTGSGVKDVQLFLDGDHKGSSSSTSSPYEFTLAAGSLSVGTHKLKALVIDALGNSTSSAVVNVTTKDGLPTTAIACDGGACPAGFVKGPVSVSLSAVDGGAGLGATRYTLDGSDPTPASPEYTSPFSLTDATTVKFRSWDLAGSPEPVRTQTLKLDAIAPTAKIASPADGANLLHRDAVTVKVDAADAGSGVADVQLFVDGNYSSSLKNAPYDFTLPANTLSLGTHKLKALVTDAIGNSTSSEVATVTVRDGLPTTAISCDGGACPAGFVKGPLSVTLAATDGGGGLGATRYTLDGTDPSETSPQYNGPFHLTDTTTVKFRSWDAAGNAETVRSQTLKIDAVGPTAQVTAPTDGARLLQRNDLTVKVDATDAGAGIKEVQLFVDGNYSGTVKNAPYDFTLPANTLSLGTHRLKALAVDGLDNSASSAIVDVTVKDGLPATAIACDGGACPTGFVKGPVSVALSPTDGGGGLGATRFTLDGSDPTATSPQYNGPLTLTDTTTVKYRTWDAAGNAEPVLSQTLKIDAVAPTAQISSPAEGATRTMGDITVNVDASDAGSGIANVQLFVDGNHAGSSSSLGSPYQFTLATGTLALGPHKLKALAIDKLGNSAPTSVVNFTLIDGLPTTTISCDGATCPSNFVKGPVSVSLHATDNGGGLGATRYTLDGSDPTATSTAYTGPFQITDLTTVKFRSWDSAGNPEPVHSETIKADSTAPTSQITTPTDGTNLLMGNVTVKVNAADASSGVSEVELFADGDYLDWARGKTSPYEFTIAAGTLPLGTHKLKAFATDGLGNRTSSAPVTVTLTDGLPNTTASCDGAPCPAGFAKGPVSLALSATDGGGGLGATRYTLDGSDPTPSSPQYTSPFTLTDTTTVKFRTWDLAGNAEPVRTQTIKLDAVAPTAQIVSPVDGASLPKGDVTVKVDAADAGSGVSDVELYLDGDYFDYARTKTSPYEFKLPAASLTLGTHKLKVIVTDSLGNQTPTAPVTFSLNDGVPATKIACNGTPCASDWQKGPVSVSLSATDAGGGLGATRYTLDGSDPTSSSQQYDAPFTLTDTTTVKYRTWDTAGNPEPVKTETIKLDAVAPTAQILTPADGASLLGGDLTVKVDAADAGSGVSDVELYLDGDYAGYSKSKSSPYEVTLPAAKLAQGTHKLKAVVTDNLGNHTTAGPVTFSVNDGLPATKIACDGAPCSGDWGKGPVAVTLSATDGGGGLAATRYTLDGSDPTTGSTEYTGAFNVSETTTVKFRTWDTAGNAEGVKSETIKVDAVAPAADIASPAGGASVKGDITVKVNASDAGSGISDVELLADSDSLGASKSTSSPYEFMIPAGTLPLGTHQLKAIATDALGNRTKSAVVTVDVQDVLPTTTIKCDGLSCPTEFVKGPVNVALTAIDAGSGLGATRYTLDGSDPDTSSTEYTGPFPLTGTTTVKFRTWDSAGNAEQVRTQAIKIDSTSPTAQIVSPGEGDHVTGDVNVRVDAADAGSGVSDAALFVDGDYIGSSTGSSSPFEVVWHTGIFTAGSHTLKAVAADALGNKVSTTPITVTVDAPPAPPGPPTTTISCDGLGCSSDYVKGPVTVKLAAIDGGTGVGATRYTLDGSTPDASSMEYTGPFTVSATTTVKFRSWDSADSPGPVGSHTIKIDTTAPTAQIVSPIYGEHVTGDIVVKVDAADAGAGVSSVDLFADGDYVGFSHSTVSPYEVTIPAGTLAPGAHEIKAQVADTLGNMVASDPITVVVG